MAEPIEILSENDEHIYAKFNNCRISISFGDVIPISSYIETGMLIVA